MKKWKTLESKVVFDSGWYKIIQDKVELPSGKIIDDYFIGDLPSVSMVFPLTKDKKAVFVRQYRHGTKEILLELPAGTYDPKKEKPADVAKRELLEETGYKADDLIYLGRVRNYPSKQTDYIDLHLAIEVENTGVTSIEPTEDIEIVLVPLEKVINLIIEQEIVVGGSIANIFLAHNYLKENNL
ncbi:MAG: NUDIX hydrolase [Candidatus Liptonbacteria bacterium]|nr:NUDIX hydrolase [Candidatus Liptonbacteria bacterium]